MADAAIDSSTSRGSAGAGGGGTDPAEGGVGES